MAIEHLKDTTSAVALGKEIVELDKQIATLRAQLQRFGGHTAECAYPVEQFKYNPGDEPYGTHTIWHKKCDCGWAEIEKGV